MNMLPDELLQVKQYLQKNNLLLPSGSGDARRDSGEAEKAVISRLQNHQWKNFSIHSPNIGKGHNRSWYDIKVNEYYCDIKISELKTADNTNAKQAVFYFLTGLDPAQQQISNTEKIFFSEMAQHEEKNEKRDFYYLIINKINPSDIFIINLKGLKKLQVAPNNLPFQCNWNDNRESQNRTWLEAKEFLLSKWAEGIKKKLKNTQNGMPKYYPKYFNAIF